MDFCSLANSQQTLVEINFLCIHKKLRAKRLAPVLIKEVTRRVHLQGIFQALYTAGIELPTPFGTCRYYHRSLNPKKLIETGFSAIPRNDTLVRVIRRYKLADRVSMDGFRELEDADCSRVTELLNKYLKKFKVAPHFTLDDVRHWILPRQNVVYSFVDQVSWS